MTVEEKRQAVLAECLACLRQIVLPETKSLNSAQWLAASCLAAIATISNEGRVPNTEERKEWIKRQGWAFLN
jgi:hypothetical protein